MSVEKRIPHPDSLSPFVLSEAKSKDALMPPVRLFGGSLAPRSAVPEAVYGISSPPLTPTTCPVM